MNYDVIVIGSGPGGYVAAIKASQLGFKTAIIERSEPGGICLNWGCIPTKALLKSAQVYNYVKHSEEYGIFNDNAKVDFEKVISRSREVSATMSKGVQFLLKKNSIELIEGHAKLTSDKKVEVTASDGSKNTYEAKHIILATGARSKQLPNLPQDGKKIIGYRQALSLKKQPESMIVVGSGAIGTELAYFYNSIGTKVTLVEFLPNILPNEDEDVSKQLARSLKKSKIKVMTKSSVESVDTSGDKCIARIKTKKGEEQIEADIVLSAVGVTPNIENIGLEELGIKTENGKIVVDPYYNTNIAGVYAIGDIIEGPALAHVASEEGIICVEKLAGKNPIPLAYNIIPGCVYTVPEVASMGMTEKQAIDNGYDIRVGKFPFTASGKATAANAREGFIKLIFEKKTDSIIGAHFIGMNVTEMISEMVISKKFGIKGKDIMSTIHPHPSMSEAIMEAAAAAHEEAVHL